MPTIRVSLTYDEAEALLMNSAPGTHITLRARGKISAALMARRDYVTPLERRSACNLAPRLREQFPRGNGAA